MKNLIAFSFALAGVLLPAGALAQEPHHARISFVHPGVDSLKADLKSMIDLTSPEEQESWVDLKDYIELFTIGSDGERTVRVDILTGIAPICYEVWVPLTGEGSDLGDDFRENFEANGFPTRRDPQDRTLYEVDADPDFGWLRFLPQLRYGVFIITADKSDLPLLKQIVLKAGDPAADVQESLELDASIAGELVNSTTSKEDQQKRRDATAEFRKTSMEAIQQRPDETSTEFALRQNTLKTQLDEIERLMAEAAEIRLWADYSREDHTAEVQFTAKAIEDTSLDATIAAFGTNPDVFAAIPSSDDTVLSARLNHPVDDMRKAYIGEFLDLMKADLDDRFEKSEKLDADEKTNASELAGSVLQIARDTVDSGYLNAFVESVPDENGDFRTVAGFAVPEAARVNDLVPRFPEAGQGNEAQVDVESAGDFRIHRVRLAEGYLEIVDRVFGKEKDLFIAVSESQVWLASGTDALELLKSTIEQLGDAETNNVALHADIHLLKWMESISAIVEELPEPESSSDKELLRERKRQLARAIEAMQSDDDVSVHVTADEDTVSGTIRFNTGTIRFVGKMIAQFTMENLR